MFLDNKKHGKVGETLLQSIDKQSELAVISNAFSIFGFDALKKSISKVSKARLLLSCNGQDGFLSQLLAGDEFETRFRNQLNQSYIARECAEWIKKKAQIRLVKNPAALGQNLFVVDGKPSPLAIQGSSAFTCEGLGFAESDRHHMNMCVSGAPNVSPLLSWFETLWRDTGLTEDATSTIVNGLETLYKGNSPEFIYFLTLYNIFNDLLDDIDEENIVKTKTGFHDTIVWNKLYKFQRDGVLGAIDKLEKYNGCIIADSVGLGKTFEALAVIKYYELRNDRVLVLCPKKLRDNWSIYTINDKRNLLAKDRFNYDVLNHTDLTRRTGKSGEINLETINWGNYDLVVIDESHNFRNNTKSDNGLTRYSRLMTDIIRSGVKTKVLMLSATPVNNRMNDLKNQVAFITEGFDAAFADNGITSIEDTLRKAQTKFNQWQKLSEEERTAEKLLDSLNFDYFKLLDMLTIARSRKHIEKYYDVAEIGEFPERLTPINIKADIDLNNEFPALRDINRTIRRLNLSAYSPLKYVRMEKRNEYDRKYDTLMKDGKSVFRQVDREQSLVHLMRVNLLKRMESSINSFSLTLEKLLREVTNLLQKLDEHNGSEIEELSIEDIEVDSPEFDDFLIGRKVKVLIKDLDQIRWKQDLEDDKEKLERLLAVSRAVTSNRDAKLDNLKSQITAKCQEPINAGNKKVIIFTAFADTASYLFEHIASWAKTSLGIHTALITGGGANKSTLQSVRSDFDALLAAFSPVSKERSKIDDTANDEIDILIATDCISEGQNLQDCDFLVNYDIHWNPVRIIQRFGRIDRLGSKNKRIQLVNYWPNMELDEYINLEARVSGRMVLLDISATGEENVIEQDSASHMNDLEYRRKQLQKLQETVVDLEDLSSGVTITDMTLNDFKMDLSAYLKDNASQLESAPHGLFAISRLESDLAADGLESGVIFCLKSKKDEPSDDGYALAPFYVAYVSDDGEVALGFTQAKKVLDILKKQGVTHKKPDSALLEDFNRRTQSGKDMRHYCNLLENAVTSIVGKAEEKGVESLFSRGGTNFSKQSFKGMEDFEVVSYMIVEAK
jgi:SNF2 family DNA or RNA helicase